MANVLKTDKQAAVVSALAEGMSIRSVERMTGVHRDTIMRLGVKVGNACTGLMDRTMRDLPSKKLQLDEIWGFVGKKQKSVSVHDSLDMGDAYTFVALDADSKVVPCFRVGKRNGATAVAFVEDLASRLRNRVLLSTDGLNAYIDAVERGFGSNVDYGQIVKSYSATEMQERRYSPPKIVDVSKAAIIGNPDMGSISTSYVESQNLTMRMHCRRLTRLTNAFSKKLDNFKAAIGLHFGYYNFVKIHKTLRTTPAMAAGVMPSQWSVADLVEMAHS